MDRNTFRNIKRHFTVLGSVKWIPSTTAVRKFTRNANEILTHYLHIRFNEYRLLPKRVKKKEKKGNIALIPDNRRKILVFKIILVDLRLLL